MANKLKITMVGIFGVFVIFLLFGVLGGFQMFALFGQQIWIPQYLSASCSPRADNMQQIQETGHTDDPTWYHCTTAGAGKYVPIVSGIQCEYRIDNPGITRTVKICDGFTENKDDLNTDKCKTPVGASRTPIVFNIPAGDSVYINTNRAFGDAELFAKYPSYGLKVETADGRVLATTTTCELTSLSREYHTIDAKDVLLVVPDAPFNAVTGLQLAIPTHAVTLSGIEGGKPIYITRPGYYFMINTADDGFKYVDTAAGEKYNNLIECIPRTTGCSDEAKMVPLVDQSCDKFGGAITDYSPVAGDNTKLCKYSCEDGKLTLTSDCITVQKDCPEDKPLWDARTGECVTVVPPPVDEEISFLPWIILGIIALIIIILVILLIRKKRTGAVF